jgi:hypothetical protein
MARTRSRETEAYWRGLIERQADSQLSVWRFCDRAGVSTASFYAWKRKFRGQAAKHGGQTQTVGPLVPVRLIADVSSALIAIELPDGIVVRLPATSDPACALCAATLVRALTQQGAGPC